MMNSVRACLDLKGGEMELFIELRIFRGHGVLLSTLYRQVRGTG